MSTGKLIESVTIPAHHGGHGDIKKGQSLRIVDVEGQQVADFVAVKSGDPTEFQDCVYTSWHHGRYHWREGDTIRSNLMNDMWTITSDKTANHYTGGGFCSNTARRMYLNTGGNGCRDTIQEEYRKLGFDPNYLQSVACFNIFMTVNYSPDGDWIIDSPVTKAGDYIELRAEMDLTWMVSVCAWPEVVNGDKPTPLRFDTYDS